MTAQNSAAKSGMFYKFLPYYLNKVKHLKPQLIMSIIFSMLSYPAFALLIDIACPLEREYYRLMELAGGIVGFDPASETYALFQAAQDKLNVIYSFLIAELFIGALSLVGLFIFTFVTMLRSFRYLYNKSVVDMDYSLPVDHNTRFFGDLAAVFTVNILPHLCSILLGQILMQFSDLAAFDSQGSTQAIGEAIMGPMAFTGLFMCIMEIAITLLMISFCGRLAEACIYPILINFAIPVIHMMTVRLVESGVYGAVFYPSSTSYSIGTSYPITASSPIGMLIMTLYSMMSTCCVGNISDFAPIFRPEYGIPALLITLACLAGAYFLIKYRRTERVGTPYVYKGMGLVIPGIIIFAITVPVSYYVSVNLRGQEDTVDYYNFTSTYVPGLIIGAIIATFVLYIIMELISGRNFRKFGFSVAKWAGTIGVCALICFVLNMSNGFGAAYYIPDPSKVASAGVVYTNNNSSDEYRSSWLAKNSSHIVAIDGDTEMLQLVKELHEEVPKNSTDWVNEGYTVEIGYVMKDGTQLERRYSVSEEIFDDFRRKMITPEGWYTSLFNSDELKMFADGYTVGNIWLLNLGGGTGGSEFLDAVKEDCQKINLDFIENQPSWKYEDIYFDFIKPGTSGANARSGGDIRVYDWMENTIQYLDSIGVDIADRFTGEGYKTAFILKNSSSYNEKELFAQSEGYSYDEMNRILKIDYETDRQDYSMEYTYGRLSANDPELRNLIEVCGSEKYFTKSDFYTILLFKSTDLRDFWEDNKNEEPIRLVVPEEYNSVAENILQRCMVQEYQPPVDPDVDITYDENW